MSMLAGDLLPTIKCSDCGVAVSITDIGDHVCSKASERECG